MLKILSLLVILLFSVQGMSQTYSIDSLKLELSKTTGQQHIKILYELGYHYISFDSSIARNYIKEGILLAKESKFHDLIITGKIKDALIDHQYQLSYSSLDKSLEIFRGNHSLTVEDSAMVIGMIGTALTDMNAYEYAIDYRKKLVDINLRHERSNLYYPLENIAYLYSVLNQTDSASHYYDQALAIAENRGNENWQLHCLNNMGHNFYSHDKWNRAQQYYELAIDKFKSKLETPTVSDSILYGVVLDNIANLQTKENNFISALLYRKEAKQFLISASYKEISLRNILGIIEIYQQLKLPDSSAIYFDLIASDVRLYPQLHADFFYLKSISYELNADFENASKALKSKIEIEDAISQQEQMDYKVNDFINFQSNQIKTKLMLQQKLQQNEKKLNILRIRITIGVSISLIIILILLFLRYKSDLRRKVELISIENKLKKIKIENQQIESKLLKEELTNKKNDLTDFAIDISRKQDFVKELLVKLKVLKKSKSLDSESIIDLISYASGHSIIDENLKLFQENVNKVNNELTTLLVERFPKLTQNEIQLCSLLRLKLSSKEIASVKNITPDSVKVLRSRLRKKLNLEYKEDLQQFILNIK